MRGSTAPCLGIVVDKVLRPVRQASGTAAVPEGQSVDRIAEMHEADEAAYQAHLDRFFDHALPADRGPAGRTGSWSSLVTDSITVPR